MLNPLRPTTIVMTLGFTAVLALGIWAAPGFAEATSAWWHVNVGSRPSDLVPGGKGTVVVSMTNVGDQAINGENAPVMVTDTLPAGVVAKDAWDVAGPEGTHNPAEESEKCSVTTVVVSTVVCAFRGVLPPYTRLEVSIYVNEEEDLSAGYPIDQVKISGGDAPETSASDPLATGRVSPRLASKHLNRCLKTWADHWIDRRGRIRFNGPLR